MNENNTAAERAPTDEATPAVAEESAIALIPAAAAALEEDAAKVDSAGWTPRRPRKDGEPDEVARDETEGSADAVSTGAHEQVQAAAVGKAAVEAAGVQGGAASSIGGFLSGAGLGLSPLAVGTVVAVGAVGVAAVVRNGGEPGASANRAPSASADTATATEDAAVVTGSVATNDSDPDSDGLTYALVAPVAGLAINPNGSWTFDPSNPAYQDLGVGETRALTANYTVSDGKGGTATSTLTITVEGANDAPTAVADALAIVEDAAVISGSVATNDADIDGDVLTYALVSPVPGLTFSDDGGYQFDPSHAAYQDLGSGDVRDVVVHYVVQDGHGGMAESTLTIRVTGVADTPSNNAPEASSDTFDTSPDGALLAGSVAGNDSDPDGDALTYRLLDEAPGLTMNADGSFTFDPTHPEYRSIPATGTRELLVEYEVSDGKGGVATARLLIDVHGINDAPTAAAVSAAAAEDDPVVRGALGAADPDGDVLNYVLPDPAPPGLTFDGAGGYAFDPSHAAYQALAAGEVRTIVTTYGVVDPHGAVATGALTITVTGTNDQPVAVADVAAATEDGAVVTGSVAANDADVDGDALSYALAAPVAGLTLNADGSYSFDASDAAYQDLDEGQTRQVVAAYTVSDGLGGVSTATLTIAVTGQYDRPNVAPVVAADVAAASEGGAPATGSVATNDTDADGDTLHYAVITGAPGLTLDPDGSYSFDPTHPDYQTLGEGETRVVVASYAVTDGFGGSVNSSLTITVTGANDVPYAVIDAAQALEDQGTLTGSVAANDGDVDTGAVLTYALVAPVTGLTMSANGGYSLDLNNAVYQSLAEGQTMDLVVDYTVTDEHGATTTSTLTITITGMNDAPVVNPEAWTATEDGVGLAGNVRGNDGDIDQGAQAIYSLNAPVPGLTLDADGSWSFNPGHAAYQDLAQGQTRNVVATYTRTDEHGAQASTTLTITVTGANDAPIAQDDALTVHEDAGVVSGSVAGNDSDADAGHVLTYALVGAAAGLSMGANGAYTFDANHPEYQSIPLGETREIKVAYRVTDQYGAQSQAFLILTVTGANDTPVADQDTAAATEDGPEVTGSVAAKAHDVDDPATLKFALAEPVAGLTMDEHGSWRFDPADPAYDDIANGATRDVVAEYTVTDEHGSSTTTTLTITVTGANTAPTAIDDEAFATEGGGISGSLGQNDSDPDAGAVLTYSVPAVAGLWVDSATGAFNFDANDPAYDHLAVGQSLVIPVPYTVSDGQGGSATAYLYIRLTGTNDAPMAVADVAAVTGGDPVVEGSVATNDIDVDSTGSLTYSPASSAPAGLAFSATGDGSYSFDPRDPAYQNIPAGEARDVQFTYRVTDSSGAYTDQVLTITVYGVDDAPAGVADSYVVVEDGVLTVPRTSGVLANDHDPDGEPLTAHLVAGPAHGVLLLNADGSFTYTPTGDYSGPDSFTYVARDDHGDSAPVTVSLTVAPVNSSAVGFAILTDEIGPLGGEMLVNTTTHLDQQRPDIAALSGGGFVVVWTDSSRLNGDTSQTAVMAQRFDATGQPVGEEFLVNTATQDYQDNPEVTGLSGGRFVVTWESYPDVKAQIFEADGTRVGVEFTVQATTGQTTTDNEVTALAGGGFVVTWADDRDGDHEIRAQVFDADGAPVGGEVLVNTSEPGEQRLPQVSALPGGGFVVCWMDFESGGAKIQKFDASGTMIGDEIVIANSDDAYVDEVTVTGLPSGGFVLTLVSNSAVYVQLYDASGDAVGSPTRADTVSSPGQMTPSITALTDGGFVLVWLEDGQGAGDGSEAAVKAQLFNASGARIGESFICNTITHEYQGEPKVTALPDGGFAVTWADRSGVDDPDGGGVKVQVFGPLPAFAATEQEALDLKGKISILDDGGADEITVVLTVDHGILDLVAGSSGASVSGSGTNSVTISGSQAQINALLGGDLASVARYTSTGDTPPANAVLSIEIYDGAMPIGVGAQILSIREINDAPVVGVDAIVAVNEGDPVVTGTLAANDADPDGDALIYTAISSVHAFVLNPDGSYSFDPSYWAWRNVEPGETWTIPINYQVSDGRGFVTSATFTIKLTGVEDGPPDLTFSSAADQSQGAGATNFTPEGRGEGDTDDAARHTLFDDDLIPVGQFGIAAVDRGDFAHHRLDPTQMFSEVGEEELGALLGAADFGDGEAVPLGHAPYDFAIPDGFVVLDPLDPLFVPLHPVV